MSDKNAFPCPPVWHEQFCEMIGGQDGMTLREWQWTNFAKHPPHVDEHWILGNVVGCTREDFLKYHAQWAIDYADTMMATIAEREQEHEEKR